MDDLHPADPTGKATLCTMLDLLPDEYAADSSRGLPASQMEALALLTDTTARRAQLTLVLHAFP